jgi:hypothetical protein
MGLAAAQLGARSARYSGHYHSLHHPVLQSQGCQCHSQETRCGSSAKRERPLSGLVLSGPKITPAVFNKNMHWPLIGPGLTSFTLTDSVKEGSLADLVPSLLEKCSNLSHVALPPNVLLPRGGNRFNGGVGGSLISRLASARGNNPTVLQVMDLSCTAYCVGDTSHVSVELLYSPAKTCPELQVLKTAKLSGIPLWYFPHKC